MQEVKSCGNAAPPYQAAEELAKALTAAGQLQTIESGKRLYSFGDAADGVYLIVKGTARVSLPGEPGKELVCRWAGQGSVLGLTSALCAKSYQFDVEAVEAVEAIFLPMGTVNEILRRQPELCMQTMNMMCDELSALRHTTDHMRNCCDHSCSLHGSCIDAASSQ